MNLEVYAECDLLLEICVTQKGFFHFIPKEFQNFQKWLKIFTILGLGNISGYL